MPTVSPGESSKFGKNRSNRQRFAVVIARAGTDCGRRKHRCSSADRTVPASSHFPCTAEERCRTQQRSLSRSVPRMPRISGIGRKKCKKQKVALVSDVANVADRPAEVESETEATPDSALESDEIWLRALVIELGHASVDEQRRINMRFAKYAAAATACAEALYACDGRGEPFYEAAWVQNHMELESCCIGPDSPYCSVSTKYRCDACHRAVCHCTCWVDCECGRRRAKWSWQYSPEHFSGCVCPGRLIFRREWERFIRGAGRSPP